ncbi:DUF302 domain-containing protein [Sulfurimonas sp.]|uniref:DUF302 domain-containing protein n=1 Tax=Sulfurimonas sp. TaxID=2022749 RepID=UPI003566F81F
MIYTTHVTATLDTVKEKLSDHAKEQGFGVLKEYSFKTLLEEKGFPIERDITVYELCNPAVAQEALSTHPEISVYLPCRISLYKDGNDVVLSTIGLEDIISNFELEDELKVKLEGIFERIKALIDSF